MKKLFFTSVVLLFTVYSFAQGISGGVKAGLNLANQKWTSNGISLDTKAKPGIHGGVFILVMVNEKFGIQPEVLFSMQGSKWDFSGDDSKFKFNYINVPVLFRYNFTEMISIHAGPQFGLLLSADVEDESGDESDIKDDIKGIDFAGAAGVEFDLPNGVGFGARYVIGFSNVAEDDPDFDGDVKNRTIQIYVKYRIFGAK